MYDPAALAEAQRLKRELGQASQRVEGLPQWVDGNNAVAPEVTAYQDLLNQSIAAWAGLAEADLGRRRAALDARLTAWAEGNGEEGGQ